MSSPMHKTDFYKVDHRSQYPEGTELVFSNWTPRKSRIDGVDKVVFFGLQAYLLKLQESWQFEFFERPVEQVVADYTQRIENALPDANLTYEHIAELHAYGHLPLEIWALPEGTHVPIGVPMFVMWNTDPRFFWLTNYLETSMSANVWPTCTSATIAAQYRNILVGAAMISGGDVSFVPFQGHDFSYRGMMGDEAAAMTGAGHLLSFQGTDTIPAIDFLQTYYNADPAIIGGSVAATEHSVMCMGQKESELETYRRLIEDVYPSGIVSIVSDTWDYWKVLTETLPALHSKIMAREGKLVVRPDSGDPELIICGDPGAPEGSPAHKGTFRLLWDTFGGTVNAKGFKQLDPHVGAIYGDSITLERCEAICLNLIAQGFVPSMVFGIGSYTYQHVTRDTFGFALKSTAGMVNGVLREIFKDPITDDGTKKSAKGLVTVTTDLKLKQVESLNDIRRSPALQRVFHEGQTFTRCNLERMRALVHNG